MSTTKKTNPKKAAAKKLAAVPAPASSTSDYRPELPLAQIVKHPHNPRHRAVADVEMVDSVKASGLLQPLVVAPFYNDAGIEVPDKYVMIAGHRRADACKKAGRKVAPTIIRRDLTTEGLQLEAMLIENGRRVDLTAIEEAEGYAQLELIGYKPPAIAKAVGRDVSTVRSRLKLLKLSPATRKKVHGGQLTIDTAVKMVEFADDPDTTKTLEKAARSAFSSDLPNALAKARRIRDARRKIATDVAKLLDRGAAEVTVPDGSGIWVVLEEDKLARIERTHSTDWGQHQGCLAFVQTNSEWQGPELHVLCSDPTSHQPDLDAEEQQRVDDREAELKAAEERSLAQGVAQDVRVDTLLQLVDGAVLPSPVADVVRALLADQVRGLSGEPLVVYQRAAGVEVEDRWGALGYHPRPIDRTRFEQHLGDLQRTPGHLLTKALVGLLAAGAEHNAGQSWNRDTDQALAYLDLLAEAGHQPSPVDVELRAEITEQAEKKEAS